MRRNEVEIACRVRLVPYGIEVDLLSAGSVVLTRVFATDAEALGWAAEKRQLRESQGWEFVPQPQPDQRPVA